MKKQKHFHFQSQKPVILVTVFLLLLNITLGCLMLRLSSSSLISLMQSRMLDISNTAASMLDGDSLSVLTAEDAGKKEYQDALDILTCFQDNINLQYIYCITETTESQGREDGLNTILYGKDDSSRSSDAVCPGVGNCLRLRAYGLPDCTCKQNQGGGNR